MGTREGAREVARIRQELRERLMAERHDGADEVLERLARLADLADPTFLAEGSGPRPARPHAAHPGTTATELRSEYERWKMRFTILRTSATTGDVGIKKTFG